MTDTPRATPTVNTVLGPLDADELGVVALHESLLEVLPGAQFAVDVDMDRAAIFEQLQRKLTSFRESGGSTIVDATGMFHGRDLPLYEALSRATGVHLIASTGLGPESMLGGYFLTPQTNPPTPWPAEKFAKLFSAEVTEGMVVPRVERRAAAGLVVTAADPAGMTGTEESLFRGAARAAAGTGVAVTLRPGASPLQEAAMALDEGVSPDRVVLGDMDRRVLAPDAVAAARRGMYVAIDHVGSNDDADLLTDAERVDLVKSLLAEGLGERVLLSGNAIGVAKGQPGYELPYEYVLTTFLPHLVASGVDEAAARRLITDNPRAVLTVAPPTQALSTQNQE